MDAENVDGVLRRLDRVVGLFERLGVRFFLTQDVGDIVGRERARRFHSIPRVPPSDQAAMLNSFRSRSFASDLGEIRGHIQRQQRKDARFERDRRARDEIRGKFVSVERDVPHLLDNMAIDDGCWRLVFAEEASNRFRYISHMRRYPERYATAIMKMAYGALIAFGTIFQPTSFGKYAGVLRSPRRNDWVDLMIAATAAHAHILLSEDEGQRQKVNFVAERFGLRIRAKPVRAWLTEAT